MKQKEYRRTFGRVVVLLSILVLVIGSCSTEKNTFLNRAYHSTTARFNGLFNARELMRIGLENYRYNAREDFSQILPVELFPNEEDVVEFYPIVDTAIAKCQKVISLHSMPTASKPSRKKTEHAKYIDQNWLTIGYAYYVRRDFEKALQTFDYVRKFFEDQPSSFTGEMWQMKTQIQMGDLTEARRTLQKIEARMLNVASKSKDKNSKAPSLPKHFAFELSKAKAMLALAEKDYQKATNELKFALSKARKKEDKARLNFIIGQLLQDAGDPSARDFYTQSIRKNAPFEMSFNAKINRAIVSNLGNNEMIDELSKLAREERYLEFRDQIYFAMSRIELNRPDREQAKYYLSRSVFYSLNNDLQKGISYEKLGDLTFEEKNYVFAQRYYDSSAQVIPETYFNYDVIKNKANRLANLVSHVQVIEFEDSVQRIANMDEKARENFVKDVIKQLKKEEQERKEREAIRAEQMRKLQQSFNNQNQRSGSKFYFSNTKAMQEGLEEFKRIWGQRENTDYWRLSNKPHRVTMPIDDMSDTLGLDSLMVEEPPRNVPLDSLTVEDMLKDIPLSDSAFSASNERLLEALYSSGMIYKEQLDEVELGAVQFQRVIDHDVENIHNVMSAFQLYKIHENTPKAAPYRAYILNNYPNTDYANYLRDPDYFIKKRERDALALKDYLRSVTHFEQGLYYPVILKADMEIKEEANNPYRKEYLLLKAMAMGQVNRDKTSLLPVLKQAVEEYPNTEVATRAQEMIDFIENGLPEYSAYEAPDKDIFGFSSKQYYVIIELEEGQDENTFANNVANFNREYFGRLRLASNHQMYNLEQAIILIRDFKTVGEAKAYIADFRKARRYVTDLQGNEILLISRENFKIVMEQQKLPDYKKFHEENYED